jgi:hypothetical protein
MRPLLWAAAAFSLGLLCLCGTPQIAGGTSSSENAKVNGIITDTAGVPAPGTRVLLIPSTFNPAHDQLAKTAREDTTDANGAYAFDKVAPGSYNIEATNPAHGTSLLITGIALAKKDSLTVSADTLRKPGTVVIALAGTADSLGGQVYIPGTMILRNVPAHAQSVTLDSVPHCAIPSILFEQTSAAAPVALGTNVVVPSSDTAFVSNSAKIFINTSPTGANVTAMVTHFPLLVLLDSTFAFGQARSDGSDIRFAKQDGTPLHFQVAQWDPAAKEAVVWVSVDTVYPASATQFITMSWGNAGVANASNGPSVFDTAYGFAGVWHLDDTATAFGTADGFADATANRAFGANFINAVDRTGIVGPGHNFNGADYILVSQQILAMASSDFTIALWINLRRERCTIFSKDTAVNQDSCARRLYCGDAPGDSNGLHLSFGGKGCGTAVSSAALTLNGWHHVAFSWNASSGSASFFVDGAQTGLAVDSLVAFCRDNPRDRIVFGYDNQYLFGDLDEISISRSARPTGWIKLLYENQRPGQLLVTVAK